MAARETIIEREPDLVLENPGDLIITPEEQLLVTSSLMQHCWMAWLAEMESDGWTCNKTGFQAAPTNVVVPTFVESGGPDDVPYGQGGASDPVGMMYTSATVIPTAGNWTIYAVARAGTSASSGAMSIVGNNGNAIVFRLRTSDICRAVLFDASIVGTTLVTGAATSADWHFIALSYNATSDKLTLWVDGVSIADATVALTFGSSRLALFGGYDLVDDLGCEGRSLRIATAGVLSDDIDSNASLKATLEAAIYSRMPSLEP